MIRILALFSLMFATACIGDETVAKYGAAGKVWTLVGIDGEAFTARATMEFGQDGAVSGQAPCNRFFTKQTQPYPWFKTSAIGSTKMACADLKSEAAFFEALGDMSLSEVSKTTLLLANDAGRTMTFKAE
ncbi:META domain-containing protein [Planktotalea sp.]|uniref:META domain-containing protein n=1 Tax=Planktotalea sp. TaxID=2029877 RepID=UPI0025EDA314|nr:META domain-containing protein [Planktotalea sp.]